MFKRWDVSNAEVVGAMPGGALIHGQAQTGTRTIKIASPHDMVFDFCPDGLRFCQLVQLPRA
jgi:hypothetical protein